jgi:hypothetical protein
MTIIKTLAATAQKSRTTTEESSIVPTDKKAHRKGIAQWQGFLARWFSGVFGQHHPRKEHPQRKGLIKQDCGDKGHSPSNGQHRQTKQLSRGCVNHMQDFRNDLAADYEHQQRERNNAVV